MMSVTQTPSVSVVLPTHNPDRGRLKRTVDALRQQTLRLERWELVVVDNASDPSSAVSHVDLSWHPNARCISEPTLGLTAARTTGFRSTRGGVVVLVDDDNVLDRDYLIRGKELLAQNPQLGAVGGKSLAEFEAKLPAWAEEFLDLLAIRDLGDAALTADAGVTHRHYPTCAPIGAGMVLRREAVDQWLQASMQGRPPDRRGLALSSGGDNDIVLTILGHGWQVGYDPELVLTHLIPSKRLERRYLARLNFGIQKSWVAVLARHGIRPWRPISRLSAPLRSARAGWRRRAWRGPAEFVRWRGDCGRFAALAELPPVPR